MTARPARDSMMNIGHMVREKSSIADKRRTRYDHMGIRGAAILKLTAGNVLIGAGGVVAAAGAAALAAGVTFALPPELYTIVVYKGIFAAAAGLMAVGAIAGRYAKQKETRAEPGPNAGNDRSLKEPSGVNALDPGSPARRPVNAEDSSALKTGGNR